MCEFTDKFTDKIHCEFTDNWFIFLPLTGSEYDITSHQTVVCEAAEQK